MKKELALGGDVDIGIKDLSHVYKTFFDTADSIAITGEHPYPHFDYLYEEYVAFSFQQKTHRDKYGVERDMKFAKEEVFDVEEGYRPEAYGINQMAEFYNALLNSGLVFEMTDAMTHKKKSVNQPIVEVW
jgi:hypothetical protein